MNTDPNQHARPIKPRGLKKATAFDGLEYNDHQVWVRLSAPRNRPGAEERWAVLDQPSGQILKAKGVLGFPWHLNSNGKGAHYVRATTPAGKLMIARAVMGEPPRTRITYRNGDHTDLRRCNLVVQRGRKRTVKRVR